jgi:hypothetical protein
MAAPVRRTERPVNRRKMVDQNGASWNRLQGWFELMNALKKGA